MKINWGTGITLTIIIFTIITLLFVYFSFEQNVNLVRDDYYEAELRHDINSQTLHRTKLLSKQIVLSSQPKNIVLKFPNIFEGKNVSGTIYLYRPSDRNLDINIPIQLDSLYFQYINSQELKSGLWKAQIEWQVDSIKYFSEETIMVN